MQAEQITNLAIKYQGILKARGHQSSKTDTSVIAPSPDAKLNHTLWMCYQIPLLTNQQELEKATRWLAFVQGVLWSYDIETVDQMREDNKVPA